MKFFKAIGSIFNPKKLASMVNFSLLFGFFISIVLVFFSFGTANLKAESYVCKSLGGKYFLDLDINDYEKIEGDNLHEVKINDEHTIISYKGEDPKKYELDSTYKNKSTGKLLKIKTFYELGYENSVKDLKNRDGIKEYLTTPDDFETDDVLIIFTKTSVYMILNHGYVWEEDVYTYNYITFDYQDRDDDNLHEIIQYYKPLYDGDTSLEGEVGTKEDPGAYPVIKELSKVFENVIPELSIPTVNSNSIDIESTDPLNVALEISKYYISFWTANEKLVNTCRAAFPYHILLPILVILVTWLISRKKGNLKSFKEYFNLNIFTFIPVVVIDLILGLFLPYSKFVIISAVIAMVYYCIMAYVINNSEKIAQSKMANNFDDTLSVNKENAKADKVLSIQDERDKVSKIG